MNKALEQTSQILKGATTRAHQALDALDKQIETTNEILADLHARLALEVAKRTSKDSSDGSPT